MRWIWIDKFIEFTSRVSATSMKNVSLAEEHVHDLYPAFPIAPNSLIVEGMAQTAGLLVGEARGFAEKVVLAKIGRATFYRLVRPGETIQYAAKIEQLNEQGAAIAGRVTVTEPGGSAAGIIPTHTMPDYGAIITGTGSFVPEKRLTNDDLARTVETNDEWITQRTGIKERRIAGPGESTATLATHAARRALDAAGLEPKDIDLVLCGTITPEMAFPSTACFVAAALGMTTTPA